MKKLKSKYYKPLFACIVVFTLVAILLLLTPGNINVVKGERKSADEMAATTAATSKTFSSDNMFFSPSAVFSNPTTITVFESNTFPTTPASQYPSNIVVSGLTGTTNSVTVTLNSINEPRSNNLAILLVAPNGDALTILSEVGSTSIVVSNATVTLSDSATTLLPSTGTYTSGTYLPTDREPFTTTGDVYPAPAPASFSRAAPTGSATFASVFNGDNPNGTWKLYTYDARGGGGDATIAGWSLNITAVAPTASSVSVSGKVATKSGQGVSRALVTLTDSDGQTVTVTTNPFGYYRFSEVSVGESYTISVKAKNRRFSPSVQLINVNDFVENVNFYTGD